MDIGMKQSIVLFVLQMIEKEGIRAVRMDDIAKKMGISKRTIYRLFYTKQELIHVCMERSIHQTGRKLQMLDKPVRNSMEKLQLFTQSYLRTLYRAQKVLWQDFSLIPDYRESYMIYHSFWENTFKVLLSECKRNQYIVEHVDMDTFVTIFMSALYNARLTDCCYHSQRIAAYIMIRGMTTKKGGRMLDSLTEIKQSYLQKD